MDTTETLLDALKSRLSLRSDYALAKYMGVTTMTMSRWRAGGAFSDENAIHVAKLLELPPAYVLACMGAQRADSGTETSGVWRQIADAFHHRVALWLVCLSLGFTGFLSSRPVESSDFFAANNIDYAKLTGRRMRPRSRKRQHN